jgi:hypothetical protein
MTKDDKPEIIFAPGCFDSFEGTQEELDELVAEIQRMVDSGELFEKATPVSLDDLSDDDLEILAEQLGMTDEDFDIDEDIDLGEEKQVRKLH